MPDPAIILNITAVVALLTALWFVRRKRPQEERPMTLEDFMAVPRNALLDQEDAIATEIAERDAMAVPSNWRRGMGVFSKDTLDADASLEGHRREAQELRDQELAAERYRAEAQERLARMRRWRWLPWSKYRKGSIEVLRFELENARHEAALQRGRATKYKDAALSGKKPSTRDQFNIDHGIPDDRMGLASTDPTPDDDDVLEILEVPTIWRSRL